MLDINFRDKHETRFMTVKGKSGERTVMGAKTTCRDRWLQIVTEAGRADFKYFFTKQLGLTSHQLKEMESLHVGLVVPMSNIGLFSAEFCEKISSLAGFISMVKERQESMETEMKGIKR